MQEEQLILDKSFRLENFYKIVDREANLVIFNPNAAQRHFQKNKHNRNIILKSRRLGFTTYNALNMLDSTLFNPNFQSLFISYDEDSSTSVFNNIINLAWVNMPPHIQQLYKVDSSSAKTLRVDFGDKTFSTIQVKTSGRGSGLNHIHISEFGKICAKFPLKAKEIMAGTFPSITPQGEITIESTAEGEEGYFHDMFWEAFNNPKEHYHNKEWKAFFYNWQWDSYEIDLIKPPYPTKEMPPQFIEYQEKHNEKCKTNNNLQPITDQQLTFWYYKYIELGRDWSTLLQEYPTTPNEAFVSSGEKFFQPENLEYLKPQIITPDIQGSWHIFQKPNQRHSYTIGVDPSGGVGRDHSAIVVLDISTKVPTVVAEFASNNIQPDVLAFEISNKSTLYNNAFSVVERNNTGYATLTRLKDLLPHHLIYKETKLDYKSKKESDRYGWNTNGFTKPKMFYDLNALVEEQQINVPSKRLQHELRLYDKRHLSQSKTDVENATNHFDLLTALTLAVQGIAHAKHRSQDIITISTRNLPDNPNNPSSNDKQKQSQTFDPFAGI